MAKRTKYDDKSKLDMIEIMIMMMIQPAGAILRVERIFGLKSREFQSLRPDILSKQIIQGE